MFRYDFRCVVWLCVWAVVGEGVCNPRWCVVRRGVFSVHVCADSCAVDSVVWACGIVGSGVVV